MFLNLLPTAVKNISSCLNANDIMNSSSHYGACRSSILVTFLLVALTLFLDVGVGLANYTNAFFQANFETTRLLISALIGVILTLSAFTLFFTHSSNNV